MSADLVRWIALGGTIQSVGHDPLDAERYFLTGQTLSPEELLAPVAEYAGPVDVQAWASRPSHLLGWDEVRDLVTHLRAIADHPAPPAGIVVSCGSNGLEEIAYLLWLLYPGPVPVVVTAAMRPPSAIGSDALPNLLDSFAVARDGSAPPPVTVVSDGTVLHPAEAFKAHTTGVDTFSRSAPPMGIIEAHRRVRITGRATPTSPLARRELPSTLPRVSLLESHLDSDGSSVRALAALSEGLVIAGMGAGFVTGAEQQALDEASEAGVVICRAARTPFGPVAPVDGDALRANGLTPQKARIGLSLGLALSLARPELEELLDSTTRD